MNDTERQERIDRYLRGEMTPVEIAEMEKDMAKDKQLARDVEVTRTIIQRMKALKEKKQLMAQWEEDYQAGKPSDQQERGQSRTKWTITLITSLAACIVVGFFLWNRMPITEPTEPATRGGDALKYISTLIDDGKYEEAINLIDAALADTVIDSTLPANIQEDLRKEQQEEREALVKLRQKAIEHQ